MAKISIIGSDGFFASYGGWDQLIINLILKSPTEHSFLITHPENTPIQYTISNLSIKKSFLKGSGFQGLLLDFQSILNSILKVDTFLLLGTKSYPFMLILQKVIFWKKLRVIINTAGIEWERPQFSRFAKAYLKFSYLLSLRFADYIILDNDFYIERLKKEFNFLPKNFSVIPYGGTINFDLKITESLKIGHPFLNKNYFLSISRSIEDNYIEELCESFAESGHILVLISNLSNSKYGLKIMEKFSSFKNIFLIDGLYDKRLLDLIRRRSYAYIHTHTLCGSAPSLIEMIICNKPIISIDVPQNRCTLKNQAIFFKDYSNLQNNIELVLDNYSIAMPKRDLIDYYKWDNIIQEYSQTFNSR